MSQSKPIRLFASFFTVGAWTMLSRVAGLVRDQMMAAYMGTGTMAEAFQAAFALPNLFRRFFAEGAFNLAFVPIYAKKVKTGDDPEVFASEALSVLAGILIVLTLIAQVFMPWLVWAQASGFAHDARFDLSVDLSRIIFPYILFISLAAVTSGILNARGHFAVAAAAPVLLNVILIAVMLLAGWSDRDIGQSLAWGVVVAGVAQFALVWFAVQRLGLQIRLQMPAMSPDMKRLFKLALPALLAGGVVQINILVGRNIASQFDGAFAWLYYADRLYQLPLGVVGIAIGIVLLPELSRRLATEDTTGGKEAFNRANEFAIAITIPAAVALMVIPLPLISVMFERGLFSANDSAMSAAALAIYGAGLPAFVLQKTLQPLFFARENTKSPLRYAVISMVLNVVFAVGLAPFFCFLAAPIGTSLSAWAMVALLWFGSRGMGDAAVLDRQLVRRAPLILLAALIMGVAVYAAAYVMADILVANGVRYLALFGLVMGGSAIYFVVGTALGAISASELKASLKRS